MESQFEDLPKSIRDRVFSEFSDADAPEAMRKLDAFSSRAGESTSSAVLQAILDQSNGNLAAIDPLIDTAQQDWRNLFYTSHDDPFVLIDKLLKNLRHNKVLTDEETSRIREETASVDHSATFEWILRELKNGNKRISLEQHARIVQIGGILGFPEHQFDWLMQIVIEAERIEHQASSKRSWWKLW